ncbi:(2,3-dihydroxybenzoyl)adenylate synthase, partial [Mycobacterium tuberculosis]|nr:(2,3-dihydroxybenzoyl)adenylate synthase [Mycobacterium tuberculosis]
MPPKAADGRRPSPDGGLGGFVPFPADRAASYRAAGYWSGRTLDTVLSDAARRWPDR